MRTMKAISLAKPRLHISQNTINRHAACAYIARYLH